MKGYRYEVLQRPQWRRGRLEALGMAWDKEAPKPGDLLVFGATQTRAGVPRRIVSVADSIHSDHPVWIVEHTALDDESTTSARKGTGFFKRIGWPHLMDHFPVCGRCHQLMPCEHIVIDILAERSATEMETYSDPSICPACREPITLRQKRFTFDRNLHGLSPVTFHLRRSCRRAAETYDQRLHREDGQYQLCCPGGFREGLDEHGAPVFYCTEPDCRGINLRHLGMGYRFSGYVEPQDGFYRHEHHGAHTAGLAPPDDFGV